ncbi:MAG: J domain-containing protein [Ruminococcaceae bacterium]|nr:J domain-containing protein [Oscillospiraceae bacterium]
MAVRDPYESLGIPRSATQTEITAAYKSLAKKYHPDLNPGNAAAAERMAEINEAYNLLKEEVGTPYDESRFTSDFRAANDGGHWEEYTDAKAAQEAEDARARTDRMARAFEEAVRQRRRAELRKTLTRLFVWAALLAMLGSIVFQACVQQTAPIGYFPY